jgi:hypothetical protein
VRWNVQHGMVMGFNLLDMAGNMVKKVRSQGVTIGDSLYRAPWMLVYEDARRRHTSGDHGEVRVVIHLSWLGRLQQN